MSNRAYIEACGHERPGQLLRDHARRDRRTPDEQPHRDGRQHGQADEQRAAGDREQRPLAVLIPAAPLQDRRRHRHQRGDRDEARRRTVLVLPARGRLLLAPSDPIGAPRLRRIDRQAADDTLTRCWLDRGEDACERVAFAAPLEAERQRRFRSRPQLDHDCVLAGSGDSRVMYQPLDRGLRVRRAHLRQRALEPIRGRGVDVPAWSISGDRDVERECFADECPEHPARGAHAAFEPARRHDLGHERRFTA
ncbi:MAG: hypothetical protein WD226_05085 [Planctomycetota bacterium]